MVQVVIIRPRAGMAVLKEDTALLPVGNGEPLLRADNGDNRLQGNGALLNSKAMAIRVLHSNNTTSNHNNITHLSSNTTSSHNSSTTNNHTASPTPAVRCRKVFKPLAMARPTNTPFNTLTAPANGRRC